MEQKLPDEDIIRRYLLGVLREPELSEIEEKLLSSDELSQTADLIEDEIIEQYLDGDLGEGDQKAVETHFLRPPAHREKLRFARLLRHRFELGSPDAQTARGKVLLPRVPPPYSWRYGGAVAAVLLAVMSVYLTMAHRAKKDVADGGKAQGVLGATQPVDVSSVVALELKPGMTRGSNLASNNGNFVPTAKIQPSTRFLKVDLVLPKASAVSFRVQLLDERTGSEVWSKSGLKPVPGEPRLLIEMPTQGIRSGPYELVVRPASSKGTQIKYPFDANVVQ
jgi:hypothetical protein